MPCRSLSRLRAAAVASVLCLALTVPAIGPARADEPTATPRPEAAPSSTVGGPLLDSPRARIGAGTGLDPLPSNLARTWVLADAESGEILAAQGAHVPLPPASTMKMLTAVTLIPRLDPDLRYTAQPEDTTVSGARVGLLTGQQYTVDQLFLALFLPSANDAAAALSRAYGPGTLRLMRDEARRLQAADTVVKNPSGLDADGQVSSAYDLALFARAGLADERFARYASTLRADFPGRAKAGAKRPTYQIQTTNRLLRDGYPGAIGVKTGYTTKAGRTFVGAATRDGRTLLVTLLDVEGRSEDAAAALLDWGFANAPRITTPVGTLVDPLPEEPVADEAQDVRGGQASPGGSSGPLGPLAWVVVVVVAAVGAAMVVVAVLSSDTVQRARIRRRYR